ncbi:iron-containing alcohol dehydrogenase, partial [Staphylococcus haemolyticus]|uniref:iron-containing alcohol dehydrogenase n=1 Tax=Staphylococcus haemolyticus TaxID=1283 RepID=UPI0015D8AF63
MTKQSSFSMPSTNLFGVGSIQETGKRLKDANATKALLVTDKGLFDLGLADHIADIVKEAGVEVEIFPKAEPNPTDENVAEGVEAYKAANGDARVSLGGGSSHDAAKGIGIVVSNGGTIHDYEGVDQSKNPMVPLVS